MSDWEDKNKKTYLLYETIGTMIITISFNIGGLDCLTNFIFAVTLLCWQTSSSMFNFGILIARLISKFSKDKI